MAKIVVDAREYSTSSGRYVSKLLRYLQDIDKTNEYVILLKNKDFANIKSYKNFYSVMAPFKEFSVSEQAGFLKLIKSLSADLVHFTFPQQPAFYRGNAITTIHDLTTLRFTNPDKNFLLFKFKQQIYAWLIKKVAKKSINIIVPSKYVKNDLIKFSMIDPKKVTVIYEAADKISDKPTPLDALIDKKYLMYVGRPTPHKNLEKLVDAFALIKMKYPKLILVLAGKMDNNYERIKMSLDSKVKDSVLFPGFVTDGQLRWLYENCTAYIFPSLSEGFGLPGLEAMIHGAPVISSNATCLPEIYGEAAYYFNPKDVKSIASAIDDVLSNNKLRLELINKGLTQSNKYSWLRTANETLKLYMRSV